MKEGIGDSGTHGQVWYSPLPSIQGRVSNAELRIFAPQHSKPWRAFLANPRKRVLILGVGDIAEDLERTLRGKRNHPYEVVGYADGFRYLARETHNGPKILGTYEELQSLVEEKGITTIAVCIQNQRGVLPFNALLELKARGLEIVDGLLLQEQIQGRIPLFHLKPSHLIFSSSTLRTRLFRVFKRFVDVIGAFMVLVLLAPLLLILASVIKFVSNGSPFIWTPRVGRYGRRFFQCYFRISALVCDTEQTLPMSVLRRFLSCVGTLMTNCYFDRLLQLINILLGEMSWVGPRPENLKSAYVHDKTIPFYSLRRSVRPGMIGWAQIQSTADLNSRSSELELQYDLYYVRHQSFFLDIRIFFKTIRLFLLKV